MTGKSLSFYMDESSFVTNELLVKTIPVSANDRVRLCCGYDYYVLYYERMVVRR